MNWVDLIVQNANDLGWNVDTVVRDNYFEFEFGRYTDAGEDFMFSVCADTVDGIVEEVGQYCRAFDVDEHVLLCHGMKGAPDLRTLLDDAEDIYSMLLSLYLRLDRCLSIMGR